MTHEYTSFQIPNRCFFLKEAMMKNNTELKVNTKISKVVSDEILKLF